MINVQNLTFTYTKAAAPALAGLSFAIERGEIFGFLGPSGAGKSTTQKILLGLLKIYQGRVSIADRADRGDLRAGTVAVGAGHRACWSHSCGASSE